MVWFVAGMAGLLAGVAALRLWIQPPSGLRLTVFRPWRGDPWPRGVQESDAARFDWDASAKRRRAALDAHRSDIIAQASVESDGELDVSAGPVEELAGGAVVVEHLADIDIHRPRS